MLVLLFACKSDLATKDSGGDTSSDETDADTDADTDSDTDSDTDTDTDTDMSDTGPQVFDFTISDPSLDVSEAWLDIVEGHAWQSNSGVIDFELTMLGTIPATVQANEASGFSGLWEYGFSIWVDVDGDPVTGCNGAVPYNGTELKISARRLHDGGAPFTDSLGNLLEIQVSEPVSAGSCTFQDVQGQSGSVIVGSDTITVQSTIHLGPVLDPAATVVFRAQRDEPNSDDWARL